MTEDPTFDNATVCDGLHRITGWPWSFKHDRLKPKLDVFLSTLPSLEAAKTFQNQLVDSSIHFSRYPEQGFNHPSLTFTLRPEEAQRFIKELTPSSMVEPSSAENVCCKKLRTLTGAIWHTSSDEPSYHSQGICPDGLRLIIETFNTMAIEYTQSVHADGSIEIHLSKAMAESFVNQVQENPVTVATLTSRLTGSHMKR